MLASKEQGASIPILYLSPHMHIYLSANPLLRTLEIGFSCIHLVKIYIFDIRTHAS